MQVVVEQTGSLGRRVSVTIPGADVDKTVEERLAHLAGTMKLDGFRPGKAPLSVVRQRIGAERLMGEVGEHLVSQSLAKAFDAEKLNPVGSPLLEGRVLPEAGKDFSFSVTMEVYPAVEPKGFSGLSLTRDVSEPSEDMIQKALDELASVRQEFSAKDGAAALGDRVIIDADGYLSGETEPFAGSSLRGFRLVLGSARLIPGFEDGLVGVKAGDAKDLNLTFPAEYHSAELAGKSVVFKVTVSAVEETSPVEFNDEFAQLFGRKDMEDMRSLLKSVMQARLDAATRQRLTRTLFDALDAANTFDVPARLVESEVQAIVASAMRSGDAKPSATFEELQAEFSPVAQRRVRLGLLLAEIGKQNKIQVTAADVQNELKAMMAANPEMAQRIQQHYGHPDHQSEIVGPVFERKVVDFILSQNTVTDQSVSPEELLAEIED